MSAPPATPRLMQYDQLKLYRAFMPWGLRFFKNRRRDIAPTPPDEAAHDALTGILCSEKMDETMARLIEVTPQEALEEHPSIGVYVRSSVYKRYLDLCRHRTVGQRGARRLAEDAELAAGAGAVPRALAQARSIVEDRDLLAKLLRRNPGLRRDLDLAFDRFVMGLPLRDLEERYQVSRSEPYNAVSRLARAAAELASVKD